MAAVQHENAMPAAFKFKPQERHVRPQGRHVPVTVTHLDDQHAVLGEPLGGAGQQAAGEIQAVVPGRQRQLRLVAVFVGHRGQVLRVHVGRVGDNQVIGAVQPFQAVRLHRRDPVGETVLVDTSSKKVRAQLGLEQTRRAEACRRSNDFRVRRALTLASINEALLETAITSAGLFAVLIGAWMFSNFVNLAGLPEALREFVLSIGATPMMVMLVIIGIYIVLGCVFESLSMLLLTVPIFFPLAQTLGFDLIWFAVIVLLALEISFTTPPFGLLLFVMKGVSAPGTTMRDIYVSAIPFIGCSMFLVVLLIIFPNIALWLPSLGN